MDDPGTSFEYTYYQPEPPVYYPSPTPADIGSTCSTVTQCKRRRILRCRGDNEGKARRNLYRWAKWCADGTAVLAQAEDRSLHVLETPNDMADPENGPGSQDEQSLSADATGQHVAWTPTHISRQPTPIVCATWYPSASRNNPSTYCFVASSRDRPIRLIDAHDGRSRGAYPILHNEQFLAPTCMTFSPDASKLYAGHDSAIDVFDFARPGEGMRLKLSPSRKSKDGQKGIVSAIAFSPDVASGMYAVGTFKSGRISCYSEDTGDERIMELDVGNGGQTVTGQGVTQLAFHPLNPYVLFSTSRQSDYISVYDIRNPAVGPYIYLYRPGMTQQRLGFEVDWAGRWLTTGGTDGMLRVYDINPPVNEKPVLEYDLHTDSIGSVSLHPFKPWILTAYGSRQPSTFERSLEDDDTESEDGQESSDDEGSSVSGEVDVAGGAGTTSAPVAEHASGDTDAVRSGGDTIAAGGNALSTNRSPSSPRRDAGTGWIGALEVSVFK